MHKNYEIHHFNFKTVRILCKIYLPWLIVIVIGLRYHYPKLLLFFIFTTMNKNKYWIIWIPRNPVLPYLSISNEKKVYFFRNKKNSATRCKIVITWSSDIRHATDTRKHRAAESWLSSKVFRYGPEPSQLGSKLSRRRRRECSETCRLPREM